MTGNFDFLTGGWPALHEDAVACEANVFTAPRTSEFYARWTLEKMTKWLFAHDSYLNMPYRDSTTCRMIDNYVKYAYKLIGNFYVADRSPFRSICGLQESMFRRL